MGKSKTSTPIVRHLTVPFFLLYISSRKWIPYDHLDIPNTQALTSADRAGMPEKVNSAVNRRKFKEDISRKIRDRGRLN